MSLQVESIFTCNTTNNHPTGCFFPAGFTQGGTEVADRPPATVFNVRTCHQHEHLLPSPGPLRQY